MRRVRSGLWVLTVVVASLALVVGVRWNAEAERDPDRVFPRQGPLTEHEWLVGQIARDLAETAWHAGGRLTDPGARLTVRAIQDDPRVPRARVTLSTADGAAVQSGLLETKHFVWSPRDFEEWASVLLRSVGAAPSQSSGGDEGDRLLEALLEPTAAVLERENQAVSESLEQDLLVAGRHEEAALLLGAFALREAAGEFSDVRPLLSRMTAHLTLARVLSAGSRPGVAGAFAEVVLLALAGRQAEALQSLDALAEDDRLSERVRDAWTSALRLRLTSDWRAKPRGHSLLERREHYRAIVTAFDPLQAERRLAGEMSEEVPDWARISLERMENAEQGHRYLPGGLDAEMEDLRQAWTASRPEPLAERDVIAFDAPPDGCVGVDQGRLRPRVLHWSDWVAAFQRHAAWLVFKKQVLWTGIMADPERADREWKEARESLGQLRLFPLVERRRAQTKEVYRQAMPRAMALVTSHPELVTSDNWLLLQKAPGFAPVPPGIPSADAWFGGFPAGTTYDARYRMSKLARLKASTVPTVEGYRALAPHDYFVVVGLIEHKYPVQRAAADIEREFGERSLFDPLVMHWMAKCCVDTDPALFRQVADRLCALDPDRCIVLADQLVERGLEEAAAVAYQHALDHGPDSEYVSENLYWLMQYYFERGEPARAMRVARKAADTGSTRGMETLGLLYELMGRTEEARAQLTAVEQRHGNSDYLMQFVYRHGPRDQFEELTRHILPDGLEPVGLSDLSGPPRDGIRVEAGQERLLKAGVAPGQVVVAIDGFRVRTVIQYHLIRGLSRAPEMDLIVWNGSAYREARVPAPRRMIASPVGDYGSAGP